jgi:hypothetical protein
MVKLTDNIKENFPFISVVHYGDQEYVGIVINQDQYVTSMYDFELLKSEEEKKQLLDLGEVWWWESNRLIPISIFLRQHMVSFRYCIFTMNTKDVDIVLGPTINLHNMAAKRAKRKLIQMVRKR